MTNWTRICAVDEIPVLGARRVARVQGPAVAVFRTAADRVFALLDRCPHQVGPLSHGIGSETQRGFRMGFRNGGAPHGEKQCRGVTPKTHYAACEGFNPPSPSASTAS